MYLMPTTVTVFASLQVICVLSMAVIADLRPRQGYYMNLAAFQSRRNVNADVFDRRATYANAPSAAHKNDSSQQQLKGICAINYNLQVLGTPLYTFKNPSLDHLNSSGVQKWIDDKCLSFQQKNYPQFDPKVSGHFDDDPSLHKNLIVDNGGRIPGTQSEYAVSCENIKIKDQKWYDDSTGLKESAQLQENNVKPGATPQFLASQGFTGTKGVSQCH